LKINLLSDIHLEFDDLVLPGGDILILAGDVCEAKNLKQEKYQDFFFNNMHKYREVLYVLGNHEHYGSRIQKTWHTVVDYMPGNVTVLENESRQIDDVLFVGATLWTDFNNLDPLTMWHCGQAMTDYKHINMFDPVKNVYHRLTTEFTAQLHYESKKYIEQVAQENPDKKIVVITHMCPHPGSIHAVYKHDNLMNGAFTSNLEQLIVANPNIKVWCHGHTHHPFDYQVGETRILCNPRGYAGYEQRAREFDVNFSFEV